MGFAILAQFVWWYTPTIKLERPMESSLVQLIITYCRDHGYLPIVHN